VFESEAAQIDGRFGLASMVSISDHDDIQAGIDLQLLYAHRRAPISVEWTAPFGEGFFHLGVHNLPPDSATQWFGRFAAFTAGGSAETLSELLFDLNQQPDVLVGRS
jgi:hypothetical protein